MSGGVDSAAAALLLKERGCNTVGLFMRNWEEEDENGVCAAAADYEDVKAVCGAIGIPYYSVNFSKGYRENVFNYFLSELKSGRTPNPDVLCNREIKFGPFLEYAKSLGADYIATGHYCGLEKRDGKNYLLKAADAQKDQTYFLNQVPGKCFGRVLFPLADLKKSEVRAIAAAAKLPIAEKKDSTGLCFIGERNFKKFLRGFLPAQPGAIITDDGREVGRHEGLMYYTLGQRRGLNVGGKKDFPDGRWFVVRKDLERNVLVVSCGDEEPLYSGGAVCGVPNWIPDLNSATRCINSYNLQFTNDRQSSQKCNNIPTIGHRSPAAQKNTSQFSILNSQFKLTAKFRYRQPEQGVTVKVLPDGTLRVSFDERQRAVTPGQYAVFYSGKYCLGGAAVESVI